MDIDAITSVQQCLGQVPVVITAIHQPLDGGATTNRRKATESRLFSEGIMMGGPLDAEQKLLQLALILGRQFQLAFRVVQVESVPPDIVTDRPCGSVMRLGPR